MWKVHTRLNVTNAVTSRDLHDATTRTAYRRHCEITDNNRISTRNSAVAENLRLFPSVRSQQSTKIAHDTKSPTQSDKWRSNNCIFLLYCGNPKFYIDLIVHCTDSKRVCTWFAHQRIWRHIATIHRLLGYEIWKNKCTFSQKRGKSSVWETSSLFRHCVTCAFADLFRTQDSLTWESMTSTCMISWLCLYTEEKFLFRQGSFPVQAENAVNATRTRSGSSC